MIPRDLPLNEEVEELKEYYEENGNYEQAKECADILQLFYEMKMYPNQWAEMKRLAKQNRLRKQIGEFAMY